MKKAGGILLLILGIFLLMGSAINAFNMLSTFSISNLNSSYDIGFLVGSVLGLLIFIVLGYKSISKGRKLIK